MNKTNITTAALVLLASTSLTLGAYAEGPISWWYETATPDQQGAITRNIIEPFNAAHPGDTLSIDYRGARYGVLWAYFERSEVTGLPTEDASDTYAWNGRHVDFHRCHACGCLTHWAPRSSRRTQLGINARLLEPDLLSRLPLRHKDGARTGKFLD